MYFKIVYINCKYSMYLKWLVQTHKTIFPTVTICIYFAGNADVHTLRESIVNIIIEKNMQDTMNKMLCSNLINMIWLI